MNKRVMTLLSLVLALSLMAVGGVLAQDDGTTTLVATLSGGAEVPGPGDPEGSGRATVTLNPNEGEVCGELEQVEGIDPPTAWHIHTGTADVAGPIVVPFTERGASFESSACVEVEEGVIRDIIANPANYYINVHNQAYPEGAVRGQLETQPATTPETAPHNTETMPDTGTSNATLLLAGLAFGALLAGFGLNQRVRRSAKA